MARRKPYPTRPPSQYRTPAFYFRGGDILREREYLADEYKKAAGDARRAEYDLSVVERELQAAIDVLHEREGYTNALASFLDADTEGNIAEQEVKRRLPKVESEIRKAELELQEVRAVHLPAVSQSLQKEKAYFLIELRRTQESLDQTTEQQINAIRKLARVLASPKYQTSVDLETKVLELGRKTVFLKNQVDRCKKEFDRARPIIALQTEDARAERAVLSRQLDSVQMLERCHEKAARRPQKWNHQIERLLLELEDLNRVMTDLEMEEDQKADIDGLRSHYQNGETTTETSNETDTPPTDPPVAEENDV